MTLKPSKEALEPCPFCGGEAIVGKTDHHIWCVRCIKCKAAANFQENLARAITAWNTRAHASKYEKIARDLHLAARLSGIDYKGDGSINLICKMCGGEWVRIYFKEAHIGECLLRPWAELIGGGE